MTPLRWLGLVVLVFAVSLPVTHLIQHGIPKLPASESPTDRDDGEDKDDPVVDAYCLKGMMALSEGQSDKAIAAYTAAIERDPKYPFAYLGRGDAYVLKGDLGRALFDYDRAVHLDPSNDAAKFRADAVREERDRK
jgi:tetratricopeptide (TPR) repeat protein